MIELLGILGELAGWLLLGATKFLFVPSLLVAAGYTFWQSFIIAISGGLLGIFVFYFTGSKIFDYFKKLQGKGPI